MAREWSSMMPSGGFDNDEMSPRTVDDMVVIEAAILLSMEEAERRAAGERNDASSSEAEN